MTGQVSITSALLDVIESGEDVLGEKLGSLDKEEVGEYLKKVLHWRVSTVSVPPKSAVAKSNL